MTDDKQPARADESDKMFADKFTPPLTGEQVTQVQEVINEALRRQAEDRAAEGQDKERALKDYKLGEKVMVFKNGDWLDGFIQTRDPGNGPLHVFTDRGPVTVASTKMIRQPE